VIEDIPGTTSGICGWVHAAEASAGAPIAVAGMAAAGRAAPAGVALHEVAGAATLAAYGARPESWFAAQDGVAVALKGRPRWPDAESERCARDLGPAAAGLRLYLAHGDGFLGNICGAFAVVVVDRRNASALLAVDRFGIERLCFASTGDGLVFGTSAESVAAHPRVGRELSPQAIFNYLYCHMVPAPGTVFAKVGKLLPAEVVRFAEGRASRSFYWRMRYQATGGADEAGKAERLRRLLRQSVQRTCDDEATGAFLSGGTDSSTVSGLLGEIRARPADTFSIGFAAEGFDEMAYARITARHFATRAHEYYVTPDDVAAAMPLIASVYDEPFGNASAVPTYYCARLARKSGISVMLAGDGGDEIFGGNARYAKQKVFDLYLGIPASLRNAAEPLLLAAPGAGFLPPLRKLQSYVRQARVPLPARLETYNLLERVPFSESFEPGFLASVDPEEPIRLMQETWDGTDAASAVDRMMHLDLKFTLADNDLRKVHTMCEVAGIDVRFPMLDEDLVAFSGTLTPEQKVRGQALRHFFKHSLRGFLPPETIGKQKHGFGLPFGAWLASHRGLQAIVNDAFGSLAKRGIVRPDYLRNLLDRHSREHATYFGVMIWVLAQLELWLQHHSDNRTT
jgi:asparagine synthase (glutamine-hydrolysing)